MKFLLFSVNLSWECPAKDYVENNFFNFQPCFGEISPNTVLFLYRRKKNHLLRSLTIGLFLQSMLVLFVWFFSSVCTWGDNTENSEFPHISEFFSRLFQLSFLHLQCAFHINVCYLWLSYSWWRFSAVVTLLGLADRQHISNLLDLLNIDYLLLLRLRAPWKCWV